MDLHSELRYNADPWAVFGMLTDEKYIEAKTIAANAVRHHVAVHHEGDRVTIDLTRVMPPDVPDFVRKFVGETIDIKQVEVWEPAGPDGSRTGTINLEMVGAPVTCTGRLSLKGSSGGTVVAIDGTLQAAVPLFGGKIEDAVHGGLMHVAKVEQRVGEAWLAERH